MITNIEIEVVVCFFIALLCMITMNYWFVRIRRNFSFIMSVWIAFTLVTGSGLYLLSESLDFGNEKNTPENLSVLIPPVQMDPVSTSGIGKTGSIKSTEVESIGFEQTGLPHVEPGFSRSVPVAFFQMALMLFFIGIYFAAKNDLFRERFRVVREQLQDATRGWRDEKNRVLRENQMKRTFLNNVSHEIRTPLNAILGLSQVIQMQLQNKQRQSQKTQQDSTFEDEDFDNENDGANHEIFELIKKNGADLIFVVENMVLFSSLDAKLVKIQWSEIDFFDFLKELKLEIRKKSLWDTAEDPGRQIIISQEFPPRLISDVYCLMKILLNLWENAVKFSRNQNVHVRFAITPENLRTASESSPVLSSQLRFVPAMMIVEISDSGIGMSREQLQQIFQPFYQADASSTRSYNGLGLGLAITKRLTQMLGGKVNVQSEPGKGSRFTLELPTWVQKENIVSIK